MWSRQYGQIFVPRTNGLPHFGQKRSFSLLVIGSVFEESSDSISHAFTRTA